MDHLTKLYGKSAVGIHGHELPKFADSAEKAQYWKLHHGFNESPEIKSQRDLQRSTKYWAQPDQIYINDVQDSPPVPAILKKDYYPQKYKRDVVEKVNHVNTITSEEKEKILSNKMQGSWAMKEADIRKWRSTFDDDPHQRPSYVRDLNKPMYSSFTADRTFPYESYSPSAQA
jgi:hypothetical protein